MLRYYEAQGLLHPGRTRAGHRTYTPAHARIVKHIRSLVAAGLTTSTIARVLPCLLDDGTAVPATCPVLINTLKDELSALEMTLATLADARTTLAQLIASSTRAATA